MADYYISGEERFGPVTSFLYYMAGKLPLCKRIYAFVEDDLKKSTAKVILDIGMGPGDIPINIGKDGNRRVFGIDPSENMVRIARDRSKSMKNVKFAMGSSRHIPFKMKFDLIYASSTYHHWERKIESLNYISKFINKNGELRIYEHDMNKLHGTMRLGRAHALDIGEFRKTVQKTHLRIVKIYEKNSFVRISLKKK